jgi:nucleoside-diphosphate-sugar epimerase
MTRILVTGATGGFGRLLYGQLQHAPGVSVFESGRADHKRPGYIRCNFSDAEDVEALIAGAAPDVVFHLVGTLGGELPEAYEVNVMATHRLLSAVRRSQPLARIVLIGSAAEYGLILPEANPVPETHVLAPVSVYGLTKSWQTQLGKFQATHGLDVVIARMFNLDGPNLSEKLFAGRVDRNIRDIIEGKTDHILIGSLDNRRDYVKFETAFEQIMTISRAGLRGEIYHVGSGRSVSMRELLASKLEKAGLDFDVVRDDPRFSNRKGFDVPEIYADMTKTWALQNGS